MKQVRRFFEQLGFKFGQDLKALDPAPIFDDAKLTETLYSTLYFYKSTTQTNTSFYLLTTSLPDKELKELQSFIWNENKADLLFIADVTGLFAGQIHLFYAKAIPGKALQLDTFKITDEEEAKLEEIKKWRFESGAFWLNYFEFLKNHPTKSIDKELVRTLYALKQKLNEVPRLVDKAEIIQALIDRTLYIKYLEDNHIINSYFYGHYFKDSALEYKTLLKDCRVEDINKLFSKINDIFNNDLFEQPNINPYFLTHQVCKLIYDSLAGANTKTGQLRLFDFKFNIIPVDLISYIYEVFLTDVQKDNGIYYTPKKLAQLIVDQVIPKGRKGAVLDPACGSGMFLSVALERLIENTATKATRSVEKEIEHRLKLLRNEIFGIEKQEVARRFTIFSLSLQVFRGLDPEKIKGYIAKQISEHGGVTLFKDYSFHENILCQNTLSITTPPFKGRTFDYIVGNPPFYEIKPADVEIAFLREHKLSSILYQDASAGNIVANNQISQCFFIKIKDWATPETRFGFVSNSSNFYNDNSDRFQHFFYASYELEKIYDLSQVKDILFEKAKETVVALVFNNKAGGASTISYYPVDMELFSEKPFELLIVKEDTAIDLKQTDLRKKKVRLRDYLVGNRYDSDLIKKIYGICVPIENYFARRPNGKLFIHTGGQIAGVDKVLESEGISRAEYDKDKKRYLAKYTRQYARAVPTREFNIPFVSYNNLSPFKINGVELFVKNNSNFRRKGYNDDIYEGEKILWSRLNTQINAAYYSDKIYFDFDVHVIKLNQPAFYLLFTAILNSELVNYVVNTNLRKRIFDRHPKIGKTEFCTIPIPKEFDEDLVDEISEISKKLTSAKSDYTDKLAKKLNELVYDLYDLSYTERQRIKDYFAPNSDLVRQVQDEYKKSLTSTVEIFLQKGLPPENIEFSDRIFNLRVVKISLKGGGNADPSSRHLGYKMLSEIFEQNHNTNYLASQEKVWGKNCVYIIRKNESKEWTQTKAHEDGQEILKQLRQ